MSTVLPARAKLGDIWQPLGADDRQEQRLLPLVGLDGELVGVVTRLDISERIEQEGDAILSSSLSDLARKATIETHPDEPLRVVVYRMAEKGVTRMPVVERSTRTFLGLVSLNDLLKARARHLEEERRRERPLKFRFFLPGRRVEVRISVSAATAFIGAKQFAENLPEFRRAESKLKGRRRIILFMRCVRTSDQASTSTSLLLA